MERGCRSEKALKLAEISASQVSRIAQLLDEELEQFRERELGEYRVGTVQDLAILKAIGVNCWGKREVLGVSVALSEESPAADSEIFSLAPSCCGSKVI